MYEKTAFLRLFGDSPLLRVMDFLMVNEEFDYSMTDIAKLSGVGYATLKLFWPLLEQENVVTLTRVVGRAKMYTLNFSNPIVKKFKEFYWETVKNGVRATAKQKIVAKN